MDIRIMVSCSFVCLLSVIAHAESLAVLASRMDPNCIALVSTGQVCRRTTPPYIGVRMRYWQPVLLVETVQNPGDTAINEYRPFLGGSLKYRAAVALGVRTDQIDSGSSGLSDTTFTQMSDVHVFGFPITNLFSAGIEPVCEGPPDFTGLVSYLSELDAVEWRTMKNEARHAGALMTESIMPQCGQGAAEMPGLCMGAWGVLYPRGGSITTYSAPAGSAGLAFRAVSIASDNPVSSHRRQTPLSFSPGISWDRMQMIYPKKSGCLRIGEDPRYWEDGKVSPDGKYVWIYWRKKECCFF